MISCSMLFAPLICFPLGKSQFSTKYLVCYSWRWTIMSCLNFIIGDSGIMISESVRLTDNEDIKFIMTVTVGHICIQNLVKIPKKHLFLGYRSLGLNRIQACWMLRICVKTPLWETVRWSRKEWNTQSMQRSAVLPNFLFWGAVLWSWAGIWGLMTMRTVQKAASTECNKILRSDWHIGNVAWHAPWWAYGGAIFDTLDVVWDGLQPNTRSQNSWLQAKSKHESP